MIIETSTIIAGVAITLVAGGIIATIKHIGNSSKHPRKVDIVFTNVCEPKMKGLSDCIEQEIIARKEAYKELKEDMTARFDRLEDLIINGIKDNE